MQPFECKSEARHIDPSLYSFLEENNIASQNIHDAITSMDLTLKDLTGMSADDLSKLYRQLHLSFSDKLKFKIAINTLTKSSLSGISSKCLRRISNINNNAYYILGDGVSSSTVENESKMNLIAINQNETSLGKVSVTMIGGGGTGKSSIVARIIADEYVIEYDPTIEDSYLLCINIDNLPPMNMKILDTAGQEEFAVMQYHWIKTCEVILLVYSVTSKRTFEYITNHWMQKIDNEARNVKLMVLIGNKVDLDHKREVEAYEAYEFAQKNGMLFVETSAKSGYNVKLLIYSLVSQIERCGLPRNNYSTVDLTMVKNKKKNKKKYCCVL